MASLRSALTFPAVVNEKAARVVAAGVVAIAVVSLATGWLWLTAVLAVGFALRVANGPRWSPLGRFAATVVAPRLGPPRLVSGAPKRFAQAVGLTFTVAATVALALGVPVVTVVLLSVLLVFAMLESVFGICAGCHVFGLLIRAGVVSDDTCVDCADITLRRSRSVTA